MNVLQNILDHKRTEVEEARVALPLDELKQRLSVAPPVRPFREALCGERLAVIAEIKKASPSRGVLAEDFHPADLAREFAQHGASALSVLTDKRFFQGEHEFIHTVKSVVNLPVLRKDFIIDEYQVYESRAIGADAILLIVSALSQEMLQTLYLLARSLGLGVLVEVHSAEEVEHANAINAEMIGVNNRNLATFELSLATSVDLKRLIHKDAVTVSESGVSSSKDAALLRQAGFDAVLVGESLMTAENRGIALQQLVQA